MIRPTTPPRTRPDHPGSASTPATPEQPWRRESVAMETRASNRRSLPNNFSMPSPQLPFFMPKPAPDLLSNPLMSPPKLGHLNLAKLRLSDEAEHSPALIRDAETLFGRWPKSVGTVALTPEVATRLVRDLGWSDDRIHHFLTFCAQQKDVRVDFLDDGLERLYKELVDTSSRIALNYLLWHLRPPTLTRKALRTALARQVDPAKAAAKAKAAVQHLRGPWQPYCLGRIDAPTGSSKFVYIEACAGKAVSGTPFAKVFYGTARALKEIKLLQPMELFDEPQIDLNSQGLKLGQDVDIAEGTFNERARFYLETESWQMFVMRFAELDLAPAPMPEITALSGLTLEQSYGRYRAGRDDCLVNVSVMNEIRYADGKRYPITLIPLHGFVDELQNWKIPVQTESLDNQDLMLEFNDDGFTQEDTL